MKNHYNCIYMYVNKINEHKYVGQAKDFNKRHKGHISESKNKNRKEYNLPFNKAIRKYGIENFDIIILKENLKNECLINFYECYYINKYNCLSKENYNVSSGGHNGNPFAGKTEEEKNNIGQKMREARIGEKNGMYGKHHSEEMKEKISKLNKGRKHSDEEKKKMSESRKGKKLSEEHKRKLSENNAWKGKHLRKEVRESIGKANSISIDQYDLDNTFIKTWNSIKEIADYFNVSSTSICNCCKGKSKTSCGFIWRYHKED